MRKGFSGTAITAVLIFFTTGIMPGCRHDSPDLAGFDTVCFRRDILPVFQSGCAITNCHAAGYELPLDSYEAIRRNVTPGSPEKSRVYQRITASLILPMPADHPLAEPDRVRIRLWILQGAEDTKCGSLPDLTSPKVEVPQ